MRHSDETPQVAYTISKAREQQAFATLQEFPPRFIRGRKLRDIAGGIKLPVLQRAGRRSVISLTFFADCRAVAGRSRTHS
jgi:hypothetical protein